VVGEAIVKGDFKEAAMLFLTQTSKCEHPESIQARSELLSTQDFRKALQDFPRQLRYERYMLSHLSAEPKDFVGAFERLPQKLQELFVQAYQSYLFNLFLSERLKRGFSLNRAEPGDFVVSLDRSGLPIARTGKIVNAESLAQNNALVEAGKIRIALPLIGMKQNPSEGVMGEIEREILERERVEPKEFRVGTRKIMSGKGELRAIVSPVKEFRVQSVVSKESISKRLEVGLSFMLLRGSYATMLLRELMKPKDPVASGF
jgi:tRNA pseudouridine13 synthase